MLYCKDIVDREFTVDCYDHNVPCVFQIWINKNHPREKPINHIEEGYEFVKKHESPDISLRRVGTKSGKIYINIQNKKSQSHYFIKFKNNNSLTDNIEKLNKLYFNENNTVVAKSISKQEVIYCLNQFY